MGLTALATVDGFYAAWVKADIPGAVAFCDEQVRVSQHFEDPALPFAGTTIGRGAFAIRLAKINAEWCFVVAQIAHTFVGEDRVRANVRVAIRHLASGETFEGTLRHVWEVRNGLITAVDEYLDVARLKAFLRLLGLPAMEL